MPSIPESLELAREALSAQREELGQDRQGQPEVDAGHPDEDVKLTFKPGEPSLKRSAASVLWLLRWGISHLPIGLDRGRC